MRSLQFAGSLVLLASAFHAQTTWYVAAGAAGNGSAGAPFGTIQAGVNAAGNGDTVLVAPGTYPGVVIAAKDIVLKSTQGPAVTTITSPSSSAMRIDSTSPACVVEGFKLTNSNGNSTACTQGDAGGIQITNASPIVRGCIISNNVGASYFFCLGPIWGAGRAGGVEVSGGSPLIENCVITGNTGGTGYYFFTGSFWINLLPGTGGVFAGGLPPGAIRNCTIANNQGGPTNGPTPAGGGVQGEITSMPVVNSILWGNNPNDIFWVLIPITATACDIGTYYPPGNGNFSANPLFTSAFRLNAGSPCIDAGVSAGATADLDGVSRPQYLQVDVGAFEWRPPPGLTFTLSQSNAASVLVFTSGGAPGAVYVNLFTTDPANGWPSSGNGRWGGLSMPESIVASQIGLGVPPFIGALDGTGSASTSVPLPPGLTGVVVYAISHTLGATHVSSRSPVFALTLL